ncbi:MAG: MFS transporter [Patescibacteria group bacterium]
MFRFRSRFATLGLANFLAQYHHYLIAFVLSAYLVSFVGEANVGYAVAGGSVIAALALLAVPAIFSQYGTKNVLTVLALAQIATLLGLSLADNTVAAIILYSLQGVLAFTIFIGIDLLVESQTMRENQTGNARGIMLTITNLAVIAGTLSLSYLATQFDYSKTFIAAALILVPFVYMAIQKLPNLSHAAPPSHVLPTALITEIIRSPTLRATVAAHFLLQLFFSWMLVYSPILLHDYIRFGWDDIGLLFTFAMIPYIVLNYPLGYIADRWLGEKEILIVGFLVLALTTLMMSFIDGVSFSAWATVLIMSRIGAAMVETMTETHFFKHVSEKNPAAISTFRMLRPISGIIGPLIAVLTLSTLTLPASFAVFGIIMLLGVPVSLVITDSK